MGEGVCILEERRAMNRIRALTLAAAGIAGLLGTQGAAGQEATPAPPPAQQPGTTAGNGSAAAPLQLTLQDALDRARQNSTPFQAALTTAALARQDRTQARNALLATGTYNDCTTITQAVPAGHPATSVRQARLI